MDIPSNPELPFFAYGVFKPGELAFLQIRDLVGSITTSASIPGEIRLRDGLPIASLGGVDEIAGTVITFRKGAGGDAYQRIADLEPESQYRWEIADAGGVSVNVLAGVSPMKGSIYSEYQWEGRKDPLFVAALEVVEEVLLQNPYHSEDMKALFRLEMAYLLLWSSIERYASLRYHLGDKATKKVMNSAGEAAFREELPKMVTEKRKLQRADKPKQSVELDPADPEESLAYYYQLRSNLVHRGKAAFEDFCRIRLSLTELLPIFRAVKDRAFEDSERDAERFF